MHTSRNLNSQQYLGLIEALRPQDGPSNEAVPCQSLSYPPWLADALEFLADNIECFPITDDENAYVVEYIYPH
jgi:hypothetical protein